MRRKWLRARRRRVLGGGIAALVLVVCAGRPAPAADTTRLVAPGVELLSFTRFSSGVPQEIRVLRFRPDAPGVGFRPIAAVDYGVRRLPVTQLVLRSGAVAAINGNFFAASGNVRGILTVEGALHSEPESPINGAATPRAAWRFGPDEGLVLGRPGSSVHLHEGDRTWGLNGIERITGYLGNPDEAVVVTQRFSGETGTPPEGVDVVIDGVPDVREATGTVSQVRTGPGPVPAGGAVVSAVGANAADLLASGLAAGTQVGVHVHVDDPGFAAARNAGGGGPWLLQGGNVFPRDHMLGEGFAPTHLDRRAPRTALGRTADGTLLLVTVDGRQNGRSAGATIPELAAIMLEQGAVEALALDGGGSTAMSVDGLLVNVPSGEDSSGRVGAEAAVADGLGVFFDFTPTAARRLAGTDRVATAVEVSKLRPSATTVLVATSTGFADALVGSPLAAARSGPVLLTSPGALDPRVADEIRRLGATSAVVLGGPAALTPQVETDLAALGVSVSRISGIDRYETAATVAAQLGQSPTVLVASGESFPDALAAGALGLPVLLTTRDALPASTAAAIGSSSAVVVGGPAAVSPEVLPSAPRIAGADRYATSAAVADAGIATGRYTDASLVLARGDAYPDALVGGALRRPLLLVGRLGLGEVPVTRDWLERHASGTVEALLLGGRQALSTMTHVEVEGVVTRP